MTDTLTIRDLVSYRLQKAIVYTTKQAHAVYARKFGITGVEWRLIGNISHDGPLSLRELAHEVDIQLAQASRMITVLIDRGLVRGEPDPGDGRRVLLSLTPAGRALYRKVFAEAKVLNEQLLSVLSEEEQGALFQALETLAQQGRVVFGEPL